MDIENHIHEIIGNTLYISVVNVIDTEDIINILICEIVDITSIDFGVVEVGCVRVLLAGCESMRVR